MKDCLFKMVATLLLVEIVGRMALSISFGCPFFQPSQIIHRYYPQVDEIKSKFNPSNTNILMLSSSALSDSWGNFGTKMQDKLVQLDPNITLHNASGVGFSSLDNHNTMVLLKDCYFDYVIYYNAINDARFNNAPPDIFQVDYSHSYWNNETNCIMRHQEMDFLVIPFLIDFSFEIIHQKVFPKKYIPVNYKNQIEWQEYGKSPASLVSYKENLERIIALKPNNTKLLFLSYTYYLPVNYSFENFINHELNYQFHDNSREADVWGKPENVVAFIDSTYKIQASLSDHYENIYFSNIQDSFSKNIHFADICHFSENGMTRFTELVSEEISTSLD